MGLGLIFFPVTALVFNKFDDKGWIFSKILGLGVSSIIVWNLSHLKFLAFTPLNCYLIIVSIAAINLMVLSVKKNQFSDVKNKLSNILTIEIIFLFIFMMWTYIRSTMSFINSTTEHFMNYGFVNRLMNTDYLPAEDLWLSGNSLNYYYYGHFITAFINKLSASQVGESYNLMLALLATFLFVMPYSIGKNLAKNLVKDSTKKISKVIPIIIAIIAACSVSFSGTVYYTIHRLILNEDTYFYPDPCYYIGYRPETNDKTITALPAYMNVEGDLHAHHMDTMFALTTLALLLQYMLSDKKENERKLKKFFNVDIFLLGILLAIQKMTNYWDFPIYLVIMGAVITVNNFIKYKTIKDKILVTLTQLLEIVLLQELLSILFTKNLYISASKVFLTDVRSPFHKLLVLWGLPTLCIIIQIITLLYDFFVQKKKEKKKLFEYIKEMNLSDVYIIIIGLCAIGLIILPEIIYLKDVTAYEFRRANTMFKLSYNAATMLNICASYIIIKQLYENGLKIKKILFTGILVIFITTFGYQLDTITYVNNNFKAEAMDLRDSEAYIRQNLPDDYEAIQWIKQNIDPNVVIIQKPSSSYTIGTRISVFTGNPTVIGWHGHEWTWRAEEDYSAPEILNERWADIYKIYQSQDEEEVRSLIEKYNISYIYIGNVEYTDINNINYDLLFNVGELVYVKDTNYVETPVYIIKVKSN